MKKFLITVILLFAVLGAGAYFILESGIYNISVLNHDSGAVNWAMDRGMTRSVQTHAKDIQTPELSDPAMVKEGFEIFKMRCVICHGAPGVDAGAVAKGLWPTAPGLAESVPEWKPAELFWITKNGIKFSAMPGWGPVYSDSQLWAITAFLEKLPKLTPAEYEAMKTAEDKKT